MKDIETFPTNILGTKYKEMKLVPIDREFISQLSKQTLNRSENIFQFQRNILVIKVLQFV